MMDQYGLNDCSFDCANETAKVLSNNNVCVVVILVLLC